MRTKLKAIGSDKRHTYIAIYGGVGYKSYRNHYSPTLLLTHVRLNGHEVADHIWVNYTKGFSKLGQLKKGDDIQFDGRVNSYTKGYFTDIQQVDYELQRPTQIKLLNRDAVKNSLPDAIKNKHELIGYIMQTNYDFYIENDRPVDDWYINKYKKWKRRQKKVNKINNN